MSIKKNIKDDGKIEIPKKNSKSNKKKFCEYLIPIKSLFCIHKEPKVNNFTYPKFENKSYNSFSFNAYDESINSNSKCNSYYNQKTLQNKALTFDDLKKYKKNTLFLLSYENNSIIARIEEVNFKTNSKCEKLNLFSLLKNKIKVIYFCKNIVN